VVSRSEMHEPAMCVDVSDDVDELRLFASEQFLRVIVNAWDLEFMRECFGFAAGAVAEGDASDAGEFAPRRKLVARPKPGANDGEAQFRHKGGIAVRLGGR
jgi:hypothetical protein